ncbi:MAG: orotidine-5'-phosphate decarboxylase [Myxococcota bacterium]
MSSEQRFQEGRPLSARDRLIVALDTPDLDEARSLARTLRGEVGLLKVGLELFTSAGPEAVTVIRKLGLPVFLDLKLHDIPNTVGAAARQAGRLGAAMLTVHASGGVPMIEAAVEGAGRGAGEEGFTPPCILAVTVLTSLDSTALAQIGILEEPAAAVARLARLAVGAGAGGLVCSPKEASLVRAAVGSKPLIVTPGIRPLGAAPGDQARVATPAAAVAAGADFLVVGRPIREAPDPAAAAASIAAELS